MKIFLLGGNDLSLINFRGPLIRDLVAAGHEVVAAAPPENAVAPALQSLGARYCPIRLARSGLNPWQDWQTRTELRRVFETERPDIVLAYTIKPIVHGLPAARLAGVGRRYALVTGLGAAFHTSGLKGYLLRQAASVLYRRALRGATGIIVQNQEIADCFVRLGILAPNVTTTLVPGSGVDCQSFSFAPVQVHKAPVFLLLGRMLWDKGIAEYVAAARAVKKTLPHACFRLVGDTDPNPAAIPVAKLEAWNREGIVEYQPAVRDVRPLLRECTVYVLPSYHEGMPRSVLEAMATGRPVITTDTIGCRETIIDAGPPDAEGVRTGKNGFMVPVGAPDPLAAAMLRLAQAPGLAGQMGRRGRELAENLFDVRRINPLMLRAIGLVPDGLAGQAGAPIPP